MKPRPVVASLAEAFGLNSEITTVANPIANAAILCFSCATKNCEFFEWWIPEKRLWDFRVVREGPKVDDKGYVHAPRGPGLGMELDWEYANAHTVAIL